MSPDRGPSSVAKHDTTFRSFGLGAAVKDDEEHSAASAKPETREVDASIFSPADEEKPVFLSRLPDELLLLIVQFVATPRGRRGEKIERPSPPSVDSRDIARAGGNSAGQCTGLGGITEAIAGLSVEQKQAVHHIDGENAADRALCATTVKNRISTTGARNFQRSFGVGMVLGGADYASIANLGRVCWKLQLVCQSWTVWKVLVEGTYHPPQIPEHIAMSSLIERHANNWRGTFLNQPRVRMNGAYIAAYHYTRPGTHPDNVWVRVDHVVEFYRTLRFLPDGRVLSLLTTDSPNDTLRRMEPSLKVKGFATGTWTMHADGLLDDELHARPPGAKIVVDDLVNKSLAGYTFRLVLKVDARKGKWDRIEMLEYESINLNTGEICALPMNHKKPFYFSVVRSYGI